MKIRSARPLSHPPRRNAVRAATYVWMGTFTALMLGSFLMSQVGSHAQAASQKGNTGQGGSLEAMIAARTGVQMGTVLGEFRTMNGQSLAGYLERRGTTGLQKSLTYQKSRLERACTRAKMGAQDCVEGMREVTQQQREIVRLERQIQQGGEDATKAKIRLGAAAYFQQVREEVMPEYARSNRKMFTVKKTNRMPASVGGTENGGLTEAQGHFDTFGRSITEFSRGVLGVGSETTAQADGVEQALRDFAR